MLIFLGYRMRGGRVKRQSTATAAPAHDVARWGGKEFHQDHMRQQRIAFRLRASIQVSARCICLTVGLAAGLAGCTAVAKGGLIESPADAKLSAEVRTLFEQSPALEAPNLISVQTHAGVVYLRGLVSTPYQLEEAASLAAQAPGAAHIENLLSIDNVR